MARAVINSGLKMPDKDSTPMAPVMPTAVMGTNDNCTVSKRSVEMLYYSKPHFYRYFVKKPKKRTALINKGYLLRMKAVELRLKRFLTENPGRKVIVNLGCGYDALPFRILSESAALATETTFVDVDYEALIQEKVQIIKQHRELHGLLEAMNTENQQGLVHLSSENYLAVGCDLANSSLLREFLTKTFPADASFFILSEVAITYMPVETADAILFSFSHLKHAQFCLLEQCLPNGPDHPFASTMLKHFNKLSSPLRVLQRYQTIAAQRDRFHAHGWDNIDVRSLWEVWSGGEEFSIKERNSLRSKEIYDEHEEFALFASHYFILTATSVGPRSVKEEPVERKIEATALSKTPQASIRFRPRRDAVLYEAELGAFIHHGGDDGRSRLASSQRYLDERVCEEAHVSESNEIPQRKHHTITKLNDRNDCLLVGGRDSPERPLRDCWLRKDKIWSRVHDLPVPLFRHCATLHQNPGVDKDEQDGVLIFGGKTNHAEDSNAWYLWRETQGWKEIKVNSAIPAPTFSASIIYHPKLRAGILLGGMLSSEVVSDEAFIWTLLNDRINLKPLTITGSGGRDANLHRAGAILLYHKNSIFIIGGIGRHELPRNCHYGTGDILRFNPVQDATGQLSGLEYHAQDQEIFSIPQDILQPMLIGHSAIFTDDELIIVGGGAICFSFGSFMNSTSWHLDLQDHANIQWRTGLWRTPSAPSPNPLNNGGQEVVVNEHQKYPESDPGRTVNTAATGFIAVNRIFPGARETLLKRIAKGKPCVFESVDLGACVQSWSPEYLKRAVDADTTLDIHHPSADTMLFETKNFQIRKQRFAEFLDAVGAGQKLYLRAVSLKDKHKPACFYQDFETLAPDFKLPRHLAIPENLQHSSVLRISGPINMWLHYDTLSNILCQIRGSKRLVLFSPADIVHLKIPPGRSSSDLNVFDPIVWESTSLKHTHPYEAVLNPGDVLYLPPLWCHAALPLDDMSVAVNIFFKTEDHQRYSNGQDTYGNKDIAEYEYARSDAAKLISRFKMMTKDTRRFYLERLADEILQQARKKT